MTTSSPASATTNRAARFLVRVVSMIRSPAPRAQRERTTARPAASNPTPAPTRRDPPRLASTRAPHARHTHATRTLTAGEKTRASLNLNLDTRDDVDTRPHPRARADPRPPGPRRMRGAAGGSSLHRRARKSRRSKPPFFPTLTPSPAFPQRPSHVSTFPRFPPFPRFRVSSRSGWFWSLG